MNWTVGDVKITKVTELVAPGIKFLLPEAIPENLRKIPWLAPHFVDEHWEAVASIHTLVVESQGQTILVDTCLGNEKQMPVPIWSHRNGPFLKDLRNAGYTTDAVDTVLCTHLHPDHIGWNTTLKDDKWVATFPGADYLFGRVEWEHYSKLDGEADVIMREESVQPIIDADLHTLVETDHKITDEVWLEPTPGHTPGHVSVRIKSGDKEAVITGDIMHHPSQIVNPHWSCNADHNGDQARATRIDFMDRFVDTPTLIIGTHFAGATAGHLIREGDSMRFVV